MTSVPKSFFFGSLSAPSSPSSSPKQSPRSPRFSIKQDKSPSLSPSSPPLAGMYAMFALLSTFLVCACAYLSSFFFRLILACNCALLRELFLANSNLNNSIYNVEFYSLLHILYSPSVMTNPKRTLSSFVSLFF